MEIIIYLMIFVIFSMKVSSEVGGGRRGRRTAELFIKYFVKNEIELLLRVSHLLKQKHFILNEKKTLAEFSSSESLSANRFAISKRLRGLFNL